MPPLQLPPVKAGDVEKATDDRRSNFVEALGIVGGTTAANRRLNAPGGKVTQFLLQTALTGVKATPDPSGRAKLSFPKASFLGAFAPAPVGYVPPEFYDLHPEFWKRSMAPMKPGSKPPFFSASEERIRVFEARQALDAIARRVAPGSVRDASGGADRYAIPPGRIFVTPAELAWLQSLPAGLSPAQAIVPQLEARRADLIGGANNGSDSLRDRILAFNKDASPANRIRLVRGPFAGHVATGSTLPELFDPVDDLGIAVMLFAEGINKMLVANRVDP